MTATEPALDKQLATILKSLAENSRDEDAWRSLYGLMRPYVYSVTYRMLRGSQDLAQDASQEVFYRLVKYCNFESLQQPRIFRSYLMSVSRNTARTFAMNTVRRNATEPRKVMKEPSAVLPPEEADYADQIVASISGTLDAVNQSILRRVIEGYSLGEIAGEFGLTYSATGVRVHRVKQQLFRMLAKSKKTAR